MGVFDFGVVKKVRGKRGGRVVVENRVESRGGSVEGGDIVDIIEIEGVVV